MFDVEDSIWVRGIVVRYEAVNPHSMMRIDQPLPDRQVRRWTVEEPCLGRLEQLGAGEDLIEVGDLIEVCGSFLKDREATQRPEPDTFVHGRSGFGRWTEVALGALRSPRELRRPCRVGIDPSRLDTGQA